METSDAELVAGLRAGDTRAFERAYERYAPRIHRFALRLARREDQAQDICQETWMQLSRHALRLRDDTQLSAWLFTVARNRYLSHRRWTLLHADRLVELYHALRPLQERPPDEQMIAELDLRLLEEALAGLPGPLREVLLLAGVEGMAQDQVAEVLGISHAAARQRLSRARALLHERVHKMEAKKRGRR